MTNHTRCEYCRQLTDGLECRKCGAPLPRIRNVGLIGHNEMGQQIEIVIPDGGTMADYGKRTKIDKAFPYPSWISRSLVNWRVRGIGG